MRYHHRLLVAPLLGLLLLSATTALAQGFTAQRRPRVAVLEFTDTNTTADQALYGASVEAMLVTYLKRKSQLVVVERQKLDTLLAEWQRDQEGLTDALLEERVLAEDSQEQFLLEKIDAMILGNVTLLDTPVEVEVAAPSEKGEEPGRRTVRHSHRIEIDVKLLSRHDGRIITAAQRSGPVTCLRSIVERLGVALEQEYLRPHYGRLKFELGHPENVRIHLTPILMDDALDVDKPPVEQSASVIIGGSTDVVEPWTTDSTTYTIEKVLSGWYSMRLERPGYEGFRTDGSRWQARRGRHGIEIWDTVGRRPLSQAPAELRRFVVRVDPQTTEEVDGDERGFVFRKKGGSLDPFARRQFLDADFTRTPDMRILLMGKDGLEINRVQPLAEYAEDADCDLFEERLPSRVDHGTTYLTSDGTFDFDRFEGGRILLDDYQGERLPVGRYEMFVWAPDHQLTHSRVTVGDGEEMKAVRVSLPRLTRTLELESTGPAMPRQAILQGRTTGHRLVLPIDFDLIRWEGLPVDQYSLRTDVPGLGGWRREIDLTVRATIPPVFDAGSQQNPPLRNLPGSGTGFGDPPPRYTVKAHLSVGGRLPVLGAPPNARLDDVEVDHSLTEILDELLRRTDIEHERRRRAAETSGGWWSKRKARHDRVKRERMVRDFKALQAELGNGELPAQSTEEEIQNRPEAELPETPEDLRHLLAERLQTVDLLVLDDLDMIGISRQPETAWVIRSFIEQGGSLYAFVAPGGGYDPIVGAPIELREKGKGSRRFRLRDQAVDRLELDTRRRWVARREMARTEKTGPGDGWKILAAGHKLKHPRILERRTAGGGHVLLWLDDPSAFRRKSVREVETSRAIMERHVLEWARFHMYRRYDTQGEQRAQAEQALGR